jgi:hypothetical protein
VEGAARVESSNAARLAKPSVLFEEVVSGVVVLAVGVVFRGGRRGVLFERRNLALALALVPVFCNFSSSLCLSLFVFISGILCLLCDSSNSSLLPPFCFLFYQAQV